MISGAVDQSYHSSVSYFTQWDPNTYFPEQVDDKIAAKTELRYPGTPFSNLPEEDKEIIRSEVFQK